MGNPGTTWANFTTMAIDERKVLNWFLAAGAFAVLLGGLFYTFTLYRDSQKRISDLTRQLETGNQSGVTDKSVIEKVGRHYVLPSEEPKLVTIRDAAALRHDQPFFSQAEDGDVLLVYATKVILYSPKLDKIVEVAQIRPDAGKNLPAISPSPTIK